MRTLTILNHARFKAEVDRAIDFLDHWLMYFPRSFPDIQMDGKPVPGHATVIANKPHVYFDELSKVGWPTKYKTRDYGNPETDGHGMLMLTRWRAWVKEGRTSDWVNRRWEAINEAAEWIPWCLDNPELSFSEHGLLYAESEGGMMEMSLYCNVPCYLGLLAYADMADAAGKHDKAVRWREQAERLLIAMDAYFPGTVDKWGDVWYPRRTYEMQRTKCQPEFCSPAGLGYNQCYFAQASLLLDRMNDADGFVRWLARFCFAPNRPHPYRSPEGVTIASDASVWRRWGDLGNLYQMAEVVYTIQVILGIDDLDVSCLKLMPRLPVGWTGMNITDWPVRTISGGKSEDVNLSVSIKQNEPGRAFEIDIKADKDVDNCRLRIGPFAEDVEKVKIKTGGETAIKDLFSSGDSRWVWIDLKNIGKCRIEAAAEK